MKSRFIITAISIVCLTLPALTHAAGVAFELYPTTGTIASGANISLGLFLSSPDTAINAASAVLSYPSDLLEVESLDTSNSIFDLWVESPAFSNETGTIKLGGVTFNPGFKGRSGRVLTVRFKVKAPGKAVVRFVSDMVLANDGQGTELHADMNATAAFTINPIGTAGCTSGKCPDLNDASTGSVNPLAQNTPVENALDGVPITAVLLVALLSFAGVITAFYNSYRLRRIEGRMLRTPGLADDKELLKKIKRELDQAEEAIAKKIKDSE